ncbi:MAG TPA: hypothetical protein VEA16_09685 [Vicinamibacterales bacterium]|nr:hypothetical protein [Vicinamibacterales bacterium]
MRVGVLRAGGSPPAGESYRFRGARRRIDWPTTGAGLGVAGCWNFALRIGTVPAEVAPHEAASLGSDDVLFVPLDGVPDSATRDAIRSRIAGGGWVVASGDSDAWSSVMPELCAGTSAASDNPYAGLAYRVDGRVELIAPIAWRVHVFSSLTAADRSRGESAYVSGERQSPRHATVRAVANAPAVVGRDRFVFLNGSPFHALQAWLQGQDDLEPWVAWRDRLFWLDEWVAAFKAMLIDVGLPLDAGLGFAELPAACVVLRHDLDYSTDTSYLAAENAAGVPAVHAVLRDRNASFWIDELAKHPDHESAFHYNTARYSRVEAGIRQAIGLPAKTYEPAHGAVAGAGLLDQVRWAKRRGIGVSTLHRHLSFLIYPEWVDAFDAVQQAQLGVLGGSSMFRGQVLRWGVDRADGARGSYADHPDVMFPYWMPFKLAHAGDGGRLVGGWESASLMEVEPEVVARVLDHPLAGLAHRIVTLNYHPAHAQRSTFADGGSLAQFTRVLSMIRERGIPVMTLRTVFETLNRSVMPA